MSEPEKIIVARYRCTYCRRSYASRREAKFHGNRCWYDPANRGCKTCVHFSRNYHGEDICEVGRQFPRIERPYGLTQTLHIDCDGHRVSAGSVNPDVLDALDDAEKDLTP